jgi:flagellar basal-body rod modification protein FlgD
MAQFATLEQLTSVTENLSLLTLMSQQQYSFSLIGKEVTVADEEGNVTGIVEKVKFHNGIALLQVNGDYYYLGSVIEVGQKEVEE